MRSQEIISALVYLLCVFVVFYSKVWSLRNREIETETLIFAPISLSYIEID